MLDSYVRPIAYPILDKTAQSLIQKKITATQTALIGFLMGLTAVLMVGLGAYTAGVLFLLANKFFDGLHGAMARAGVTSAFGNYFTNASRWIVDAGFILFFAMSLPMQAMGAAFILFTYVALQAVSFDDEAAEARPAYALAGLVGATEIVIFMVLCCLFPHAFSAIAVLFGTLCIVTVFGRLWETAKIFR